MTYKRFEDLPVWKAALELAVRVLALTDNAAFKGHYDLKDQMERSAVSISNNIAEGFERSTTNELLHFIYIARGSAGELRSMTYILGQRPSFSNLKSEIFDLRNRAENTSRQLRGWADRLQNSEIKGQRFLDDKVKRQTQRKREQDEFLLELRQIQADAQAAKIAQLNEQE